MKTKTILLKMANHRRALSEVSHDSLGRITTISNAFLLRAAAPCKTYSGIHDCLHEAEVHQLVQNTISWVLRDRDACSRNGVAFVRRPISFALVKFCPSEIIARPFLSTLSFSGPASYLGRYIFQVVSIMATREFSAILPNFSVMFSCSGDMPAAYESP